MSGITSIKLSYRAGLSNIVDHRYATAGFHALVAYWILNSFVPSQGVTVEKIGVSLFLLVAVACFGLQIVNKGKIERNRIDPVSTLLLLLLFAWGLITIIRGFTSNTDQLLTLLAHPDIGGLVWLMPFAIYIGRQRGVVQALLPTFKLHALIGMSLVAWTIYEVKFLGKLPAESSAAVGLLLLYAAPFVLLTGIAPRWERRMYLVAMTLATIANYYLSNRAALATSSGILFLAVALGRARGRQATTRLGGWGLALMVPVMWAADDLLARLDDDWFVDTRSFLFEEMYEDFSLTDWLFGRGALGKYFSPYFAKLSYIKEGGDAMYRQVCEIGYLHIALKAGLVGVALHFLIVFRAALLSLKIHNRRVGIGLMLLFGLHLLEMAVIGQASFQPARVLIWMLVGYALSSSSQQPSGFHL
jgi:hypothetical protein